MKSPQQITAQALGLLRRLGETRSTDYLPRIERVAMILNRYIHNILTYYGHSHSDALSDEEINRPLPRHIYGLPRPQREYSMTITPDEF